MKSLAIVMCAAAMGSAAWAEDAVKLTRQEDRVRIEIGGTFFSEYRFRGAPHPCLYPILDAEGVSYTRDWPMKDNPAEIHDHDWHRSVWYGHGAVNGIDFWRELPDKKTGSIVQDQIVEQKSGAEGLLRTRNRWQTADNKTICTDETTIRFRRTAAGTFIDYEIHIKATQGPLVFGDTEEGTMAVRVNEAVRVTQGKNKKDSRPGTGHIVNGAGNRDKSAWGKRAPWCDYYGPLPGGPIIGVAIFDHPKNPSQPTWWHVRDYGLFAANPFGKHDFEKLKDEHAGDFPVPAGGELVLRYRILFHRGDEKAARIAELYGDYVAGK